MKKLLTTTLLVGAIFIANAQSERTFKAFKFDISAGYALPINSSNNNGGFLLSFEPKYALNDQLTLGLKAETAISVTGDENEFNIDGSGSYLVTGDYYLNTNTVRPFVGFGIGAFTHASADNNTTTGDNIKGSTRFGYAPRLGIEIAHFRAAFEYNFAGKVAGISKNYLGIKMGVLIGGGRIQY